MDLERIHRTPAICDARRVACRPPLLLTLLLLVSLSGCKGCSGDDKDARRKVAESPVVNRTARRGPLRTAERQPVKQEMTRLLKATEELRRRAIGEVSMVAPAKMMLGISKKMPSKTYPSSFRSFLDAMNDQLGAMTRSKDHRGDFNKLIDTCVACHRFYAPRTAEGIRSMKIPPRPPGQRRPAPAGEVRTDEVDPDRIPPAAAPEL